MSSRDTGERRSSASEPYEQGSMEARKILKDDPNYKVIQEEFTTTIITENEIIHVQNKYIKLLGINVMNFYKPTFSQVVQNTKSAKMKPIDEKFKKVWNKNAVQNINARERKVVQANEIKSKKQVLNKQPLKLRRIILRRVNMPQPQRARLQPQGSLMLWIART